VNGGFVNIITSGQYVRRSKDGCKLEVAICEGALGVGKQNELGLSAQGKRGSPRDRVNSDILRKHVLQYTEQTRATRYDKDHRLQLPQYLLPFLHSSTALVGTNGVQDFKKVGKAVWRQLDRHSHCVQEPAQDQFTSFPGCIAGYDLLDRSRLLSVYAILCFQSPQNFIQRGKKEPLDMVTVCGTTLYHPNEIIDIHFPILDWSGMTMVTMVLSPSQSEGRLALGGGITGQCSRGMSNSDIASKR
jgi:hypothetical protein